ncbi:MFS transporter [Nocardiopsis alba]|uniref:MFS transporter n=1 Tax=Nocardiopsis alba TaxID=53437 RepID=UPI003671CBB3
MVGIALPGKNARWAALVTLCVGQLMIILDQNIVNVALPSIQNDLGFAQANLVWVVNAYVITFGALLLLAGRLGDLIGRKRVFLAGITVFTLASVLCGLSGGQEMLVGARLLQGVGGAVTAAGILAMIVSMFPEEGERAKALGAFGFASAGGGAAGPLLGGVLTDTVGWHWVFYANIPIGVAVVLVGLRMLPGDRGPGLRSGADVSGALLCTFGLVLAVYAIVGAEADGWTAPSTLGFGGLALVLVLGFLWREATARNPLLPLGLFRSRDLSGANVAQMLLIGSMFGFLYFGVLYMQRVLGMDPLEAGLAFLPAALTIAVVSLFVTPRLLARYGSRPVLLVAFPLVGVGLLLYTGLPVDGSYPVHFLPGQILIGLGIGAALPGLMMCAMSDTTSENSGIASGIFNTTQQIGGALGLAVLNTLAGARTADLSAAGEPLEVALTGGYRLAFGVGAGFVAAAIVVLLLVLRPKVAVPAPDTAKRPEQPDPIIGGSSGSER